MKRVSVKLNKKKDDWVVAIFCDYGDPKVKRLIRASYSLESGEKSWPKFLKSFSKNNYRCWQENKKGKIINDSSPKRVKKMKFWQLNKFCLENSYTVKREGKKYIWKKNKSNRTGICDTILETAEEIRKDMENQNDFCK